MSTRPASFSQRPLDPAAFATEPSPNAGVTQDEHNAAVLAKINEVASQTGGKVVVGEGFEFKVPQHLERAVAASSPERRVGVRPDAPLPSASPGGVVGRVSVAEALIGETEVVLTPPSGKRVVVMLPEQLEQRLTRVHCT